MRKTRKNRSLTPQHEDEQAKEQEPHQSKRRVLKPRNNNPKVKQEKVVKPIKLPSIQDATKIYTSLLDVFSSKDGHRIVGRQTEEAAIKGFIQANLTNDKSGLLYVCGHPGQGKTAVVCQVLFDHFNDTGGLGGQSENMYILKYNGMRFDQPKQFANNLLNDLQLLLTRRRIASKEEKKKQENLEMEDLTQQIRYKLTSLAKTRKHFVILIDEIDAFSKNCNEEFKQLLRDVLSEVPLPKTNLSLKPLSSISSQTEQDSKDTIFTSATKNDKPTHYSVSIIGIANSVELFKGDFKSSKTGGENKIDTNQLTSNSNQGLGKYFLTKNEVRLLFKPYEKDQLSTILFTLYAQKLIKIGVKIAPAEYKLESLDQNLITFKSFEFAAGKIDKRSGDIRVCFEILRATVQKKLTSLKTEENVTVQTLMKDVNFICTEMFESKLMKIIKKLPRSHLVLLSEMKIQLLDQGDKPQPFFSETQLVDLFNQRARHLMIDRINLGELSDIIQTLAHCDIVIVDQAKSKKAVGTSKKFNVVLKCELSELQSALSDINYI